MLCAAVIVIVISKGFEMMKRLFSTVTFLVGSSLSDVSYLSTLILLFVDWRLVDSFCQREFVIICVGYLKIFKFLFLLCFNC